MQAGKNATGGAKESAANVAATAKCSAEKTKATVDEKMEQVKAHDPAQKEMATKKKEDRIRQADREEQEARARNAAAKGGTGAMGGMGAMGHPTGNHPTSALPGHGTGQPGGQGNEGVVGSQPIGTNTAGTGRTTAHDPRVEGYGTGGARK